MCIWSESALYYLFEGLSTKNGLTFPKQPFLYCGEFLSSQGDFCKLVMLYFVETNNFVLVIVSPTEIYRIYPQYSDTWISYHTCPKI